MDVPFGLIKSVIVSIVCHVIQTSPLGTLTIYIFSTFISNIIIIFPLLMVLVWLNPALISKIIIFIERYYNCNLSSSTFFVFQAEVYVSLIQKLVLFEIGISAVFTLNGDRLHSLFQTDFVKCHRFSAAKNTNKNNFVH